MKYLWGLFLFSIFIPCKLNGQNIENKIGLGLSAGWKAPFGDIALIVGYKPINLIEVNVNCGGSKYNGASLSMGVIISPILRKRVFKPYIGFGYGFFGGDKKISLSDDKTYFSTYSVKSNQIASISAGLKIDLKSEIGKTGFLSFRIGLNYNFPKEYSYAVYLSGDKSKIAEKQINKNLNYKFGFYFGVIYYFGKIRQ